MSLPLFIPSVDEVLSLLVSSHASRGGTVLMSRSGKVWNNPSTKSILNAWKPKDTMGRLLQTSFLDLCGKGDGCKLAIFVTCALIKEFVKHGEDAHPQMTESVKRALPPLLGQIQPIPCSEDILLEIGLQGGLEIEYVRKVSEALRLSGASSSHISLEKGEGVGVEVVEDDSWASELKVHYDKETYLKGVIFALFAEPVSKIDQVIPAMEMMGSFEGMSLVIVAPLIGGSALNAINLNRNKGVLDAYACNAPRVIWGRGWMDDLASFTGGVVYDSKLHSQFTSDFYGTAKEVLLNHHEMVVTPYDDHADKTYAHAECLIREAEQSAFPHDQDLLRKRANALMGTLIKVKIGGTTEAEARWRRVLVEKSLLSMTDASLNGCVRGSIPLLYTLQSGSEILDRALRYPYEVVCKNHATSVVDREMWQNPLLYEYFPTGRLRDLLRKSISIATTVGSVGHVLK